MLLTPLESKLYRYLTEHSEQICSRAELEQAIWQEKRPGNRDVLDQLVGRLRSKIETRPETPQLLIAVRKTGYIFLASKTEREKEHPCLPNAPT
jgi:DNA-binding response OmpR family regulator